MTKPIIEVENLSKLYRLGVIGATTLRDSAERWWYKMLGKEEDCKRIGARHQMISSDDPQAGPEPNTIWALKDVSFSVNQGEIVGIIGRNGAGKTTFLKILSRITEPTEGRAIIRGRTSSLLEVGTGFHPELTGRENIYLNGAILGMRKYEVDKKLDEIVAFAELEKFVDTPVKRYSSGMYVRLAFAVAAHLEPEILLVDEVLAVGDVQFQNKCLSKMEDVSKEGRTVLFVSHNMSAISNLCRRLIVLVSGGLDFDGKVSDGIGRYVIKVSRKTELNLENVKENRNRPQEYSKLMKIAIFNEKLQPCDTFIMGEGMIIKLEVYCKKVMPNAEVGIKISSRMGTAIHYFVSTWEGLRVDLAEGMHCFEIRVPQIMLYPGTYLLSAWTLVEGNWSDDLVEGILPMSVVGKDITGHSSNFDRYALSGCEVYAPSKWRKLN